MKLSIIVDDGSESLWVLTYRMHSMGNGFTLHSRSKHPGAIGLYVPLCDGISYKKG
jgi:hypothetical protein